MPKLFLTKFFSLTIIFITFQYSFSCVVIMSTVEFDTISPGVVIKTITTLDANTTKDTLYLADMMTSLYQQMDTNQIVFRGVIDSVVTADSNQHFSIFDEDIYISVIEIYKGSLLSNSVVISRRQSQYMSCDASYAGAININFLNFSNKLDSVEDLDIGFSQLGVGGNLFIDDELHPTRYEPFTTAVEDILLYTSLIPKSQQFKSDKNTILMLNKTRGLYFIRNNKLYDLRGKFN